MQANDRRELALSGMGFKEANALIRAALETADSLVLRGVTGQRYLGCAMEAPKRIEVFGTPGNDLACFLGGGDVEVRGSAQDQVGNTMDAGRVVIHGRCGDAAGYAMRGGKIFVRDDCGWRTGINMKEYPGKCPAIVIGGDAGSFLGEYMAGGVIVVMGRVGGYPASGMHGGAIYLRHPLADGDIPKGVCQSPAGPQDRAVIERLLGEYAALFSESERSEPIPDASDFQVLRPMSARPYAGMYSS